MSRHNSAVRTVAHCGPPRWNATLSRMGFDGSCEWGGNGLFNPSFSAAC